MRENAAVRGIGSRWLIGGAALVTAAVAALVVVLVSGGSATGTIVVQSFTEPFGPKVKPLTITAISETSPRGGLERVMLTNSRRPAGLQEVRAGDSLQFYDPRDNTIYTMTWRSYLTASEPYLRRGLPGRRAPTRPPPLAGTFFAPGRQSFFKKLADEHRFHVAGSAMIDGRRALKLVPARDTATLAGGYQELLGSAYVVPGSYYPIQYRLGNSITRWRSYRVLPATGANERLVSLNALHPTAQVVHSASAWVRVQRSLR